MFRGFQRASSSATADATKKEIELFVRKYPDQCITADGRVNVKPVRNIADLSSRPQNSSSLDESTTITDENQPTGTIPQPEETNSSLDMMTSSLESFILGVATSARSSTPNRSPSQRSQRYEVSSSNDDESVDVGFSRTSARNMTTMVETTESSNSSTEFGGVCFWGLMWLFNGCFMGSSSM
jgi:hypothetical protein